MIIQVRGTSGSGKSTVMRAVMERIGGPWKGIKAEGRKKPLYYKLDKAHPQIVVLGHYESACGGCDTIGSAAQVYELTTTLVGALGRAGKYVILQEGLLLSEDVKWTTQLPNPQVVFLNTPLQRCLSQIKGRRREAGNEKPLNEANTTNRVTVIERARTKLIDAGVSTKRCTPEAAPAIIINLIERAFS